MSIDRFAALVQQQPGNPLFRFSLAKALVDASRHADALPHLEACAASRADWMLPRILLGRSLLALGQSEKARPILQNALALAIEQNHEDPAAELQVLLSTLEEAG